MSARKTTAPGRDRVAATLQDLTAAIVDRMENDPGDWSRPWRDALAGGIPCNVQTRRSYHGGNVFILSHVAYRRGWECNGWGTYRAWQQVGGQVRRGEKGTTGLYWKVLLKTERGSDGEERQVRVPLLRSFMLFNGCQVEGGEDIATARFQQDGPALEPLEHAEQFFARVGAAVRHVPSDRAYYSPTHDTITLPDRCQFRDHAGYYSTVAHEHCHWTGHPSRLNRGEGERLRFGNDPYAREELVAELGAVFVGAYLGLDLEPLTCQGAAYLASWLQCLREEPRALWTALGHASKAYEWLRTAAGEGEETDAEEVAA